MRPHAMKPDELALLSHLATASPTRPRNCLPDTPTANLLALSKQLPHPPTPKRTAAIAASLLKQGLWEHTPGNPTTGWITPEGWDIAAGKGTSE